MRIFILITLLINCLSLNIYAADYKTLSVQAGLDNPGPLYDIFDESGRKLEADCRAKKDTKKTTIWTVYSPGYYHVTLATLMNSQNGQKVTLDEQGKQNLVAIAKKNFQETNYRSQYAGDIGDLMLFVHGIENGAEIHKNFNDIWALEEAIDNQETPFFRANNPVPITDIQIAAHYKNQKLENDIRSFWADVNNGFGNTLANVYQGREMALHITLANVKGYKGSRNAENPLDKNFVKQMYGYYHSAFEAAYDAGSRDLKAVTLLKIKLQGTVVDNEGLQDFRDLAVFEGHTMQQPLVARPAAPQAVQDRAAPAIAAQAPIAVAPAPLAVARAPLAVAPVPIVPQPANNDPVENYVKSIFVELNIFRNAYGPYDLQGDEIDEIRQMVIENKNSLGDVFGQDEALKHALSDFLHIRLSVQQLARNLTWESDSRLKRNFEGYKDAEKALDKQLLKKKFDTSTINKITFELLLGDFEKVNNQIYDVNSAVYKKLMKVRALADKEPITDIED